MKSKILSPLRYRIVYIALALLIYILVRENTWYIILLPFYLIYILKNHREILIISIGILVIFSVNMKSKSSKAIDTTAQYNIVVMKVRQEDTYTTFVGEVNGILVNAYLSARMEIKPGDLYTVKGELTVPLHNTYPNGFDYHDYLLSKGIYYQLYVDSMQYVDHKFNLNIIGYRINEYIEEKLPLSKAYIKTFILADKSDFDQDTIESINYIGISHLFAVSGLHVGLLVVVMKKLMNIVRIRDHLSDLILILILIVYIIITSYSPSVVRAGMMFILIVINKRTKFEFSNLDILSVIFVSLLILNPYIYKNPGFVLSFLVTFLLLLSTNILRNLKGIKLLFVVSFISFIGTIPVILSMNYQINLLTMIYNILFITYMTGIILPLSFISFIFPIFDEILYGLINIYNDIIQMSSSISMFVIHGNLTYKWEFIIYYLMVFSLLSNFDKKVYRFRVMILLSITVLLFMNLNTLKLTKSVVFLDVKGDSTFISDSFNRCNILIDTGESDEYNSVIGYLSSINVRKLDYLFISHMHSDHYGESTDIYQYIDVNMTINPENADFFYNTTIKCGSLELYIYELTSNNSNENNNSIIMSVLIEDKHYLFTGDSEIERENEFLEKYHIDVDYLKVAHHGSNTSSSVEFIDAIKPNEAFVMVYRYNMFDHPDFFVVNRYSTRNIPLYRTDLLGTIEVSYLFGNERKKYYKP